MLSKDKPSGQCLGQENVSQGFPVTGSVPLCGLLDSCVRLELHFDPEMGITAHHVKCSPMRLSSIQGTCGA